MLRLPIAEQQFVLDVVGGISELAAYERFADVTPDVTDAILQGAAAFAEGKWAPLNRIGDTKHARLVDGRPPCKASLT